MKKSVLEACMTLLMFVALYSMVRLTVGEVAAGNTVSELIAIDCGHGGVDAGKVAADGLLEKDVNLDIGMKLKALLESAGYDTIITRDGDYGLYDDSDSNKKSVDMRKRCELINESGAVLVVSIHQNSYTDTSVHGAQMFYYQNSSDGKVLAETLTKAFGEVIGSDVLRPAKSNDNYYMLRNTDCPGVIAECGFLSNPTEAGLLGTDGYRSKVAKAIFVGIDKYCRTNGADRET